MGVRDWLKERRKISDIINRAIGYIASELSGHGLISIYKMGTILTKDQVYDSDIDIMIVVKQGFDFKVVDVINAHFKANGNRFGEGLKIGVIALGEDEINEPYNKTDNNVVNKYNLTYRFLRTLANQGRLKWGKKLPLKRYLRNFSHQNESYFTPLQEARNQIEYIRSQITRMRAGDFNEYTKLPKHCIVLIRCEAMLEHNFKFDPRYYKLYEHMKHLKKHFIHRCVELRAKPDFSRQEALEFCKEAEIYIKEFEARLKK